MTDQWTGPAKRARAVGLAARGMLRGQPEEMQVYLDEMAKRGLDRRTLYDEALRSISYSPAIRGVPPFEELFPTSQR